MSARYGCILNGQIFNDCAALYGVEKSGSGIVGITITCYIEVGDGMTVTVECASEGILGEVGLSAVRL